MTLGIPDISDVRALVVGDLMLDEYWFGSAARISPEAPVPVVRIREREGRAGGAANVAANLQSLGAAVTLAGITGSDATGDALAATLSSSGVEFHSVTADAAPTIKKLRVLSRNQQLIRLDTEETFSQRDAQALADSAIGRLDGADVVVLSDYGKGSLDSIDRIIDASKGAGIPVLVDPKGAEFDRYRGASVLTPNLGEFEAVVGPCEDDEALVHQGRALCARLDLSALVITLGERGMLLLENQGQPVFLDARSREVFDVTGAGDTVIATLAGGIAAGLDIRDAASMANLAAGLVVQKIGVATVSQSEIQLALHAQGQGGRGVLSREAAVAAATESRRRGERLVMTNGCFDILHTGHVEYLEEAKARGDRLLVAVNDDGSVTRLKGDGRPVNSLYDRMSVLAGLAAVDWVVPFSQDTPEALIRDIRPDVLVKGGDYEASQVAGGQFVLENGGSVEILGYRPGRSTTEILESLRRLPGD
jgi:D-beta-D-heptose 7-phosphate kinase/D-beta-D-heptose 1-phosphate adenosyltransferase